MKKTKSQYWNWIDIALRSTLFLILPGFLMIYVFYQVLFNVELNLYWLTLFLTWTSVVKLMIEKYEHQSLNEPLPTFEGIERLLTTENWEILDRTTNSMVIRPTFDFPFNLLLNDKVTVNYADGRVIVEGPLQYLNVFLQEIRGDKKIEKKKNWTVSGIILPVFAISLPILLDGGLWREMRIFYHNAFASAEVQIEIPEEGFLGNSAENILSNGFGAENEEFVFYIENNEIIKANKNFEEREVLLDSQGATRMNLNVVGDYLYFTNYDELIRVPIDGGETETIYDMEVLTEVQIKDDWIYFTSYEDNSNLYRMDLNGGQIKRLLNEYVSKFSVYEDKILVSYEKDHALRTDKLSLDGSDQTRLLNEDTFKLLEWEGYYYYLDPGSILYRKKVDGSGKAEQILYENVRNYTITDQGIFYSIYQSDLTNTENGVYLTDHEGKESEKLFTATNITNFATTENGVLLQSSGSSGRPRVYEYSTGEVRFME
ncbi:DUF5050 domain-containing protein [Marinilactibacillus sp. Marseille-P9653]|uniref:DUF5050 domain-containing protein n=1 Tax=Marinilactibacillus sp. Marseille-P9653 TaxID=2866583 RepID=UPI001CE45C62|nr:DUF5050 domain-containing protein [Marinilactibacillus sp. Marseille-P9653]